MAYTLGPVKPFVAAIANDVGSRFGIKTIWGFGPGSVPNSDHPLGLALDFMINNIANGKATGDAIANYFIANAKALSVKYIIWNRREWDPVNGWHAYNGFNPHTDHVHVSFFAGGSYSASVTAQNVNNPLIPDKVEQLISAFKDINRTIEWLTLPENWIRIGLFVGGFALAAIAILGMPTVTGTAKAVKKVANA